jgi:hypothetical protein
MVRHGMALRAGILGRKLLRNKYGVNGRRNLVKEAGKELNMDSGDWNMGLLVRVASMATK